MEDKPEYQTDYVSPLGELPNAELLALRAERDALKAQVNGYKEWLNAVCAWWEGAPVELASLPGWDEVSRAIAEARDITPAQSLAAHDAAVWREAADLAYPMDDRGSITSTLLERAAELEAQSGEVKA